MHASYYHKAHACIMVRVLAQLPPAGVLTEPAHVSCLFQSFKKLPMFFLPSPDKSSIVGLV